MRFSGWLARRFAFTGATAQGVGGFLMSHFSQAHSLTSFLCQLSFVPAKHTPSHLSLLCTMAATREPVHPQAMYLTWEELMHLFQTGKHDGKNWWYRPTKDACAKPPNNMSDDERMRVLRRSSPRYDYERRTCLYMIHCCESAPTPAGAFV